MAWGRNFENSGKKIEKSEVEESTPKTFCGDFVMIKYPKLMQNFDSKLMHTMSNLEIFDTLDFSQKVEKFHFQEFLSKMVAKCWTEALLD